MDNWVSQKIYRIADEKPLYVCLPKFCKKNLILNLILILYLYKVEINSG